MSRIQVMACALAAAAFTVSGLPLSAADATCTVTKDEVLAKLAEGATPEELFDLYGNCTGAEGPAPAGVCQEQPAPAPEPTLAATDDGAFPASIINPSTPTTQIITNTGNTFYEALTSCGYHPQRKMAACVVEIRRRFGFGGAPGLGPGSFEHVLLCVDLGAGLVPINVGNVHVHDEAFGVPPRWYFAVLIPANNALAARPLNGTTYAARTILSWLWAPNNCNFRPVWGNQADFRIRLDP